MPVIESGGTIPNYGPFRKAGALASNDFNGSALEGATAIDTTNKKLYINTGTLAATVWTVVGTQV
jgi:hypothetical protein